MISARKSISYCLLGDRDIHNREISNSCKVISVGPPLGVDPVGKMRLRIPNKQTNSNNSYTSRTQVSCGLALIIAHCYEHETERNVPCRYLSSPLKMTRYPSRWAVHPNLNTRVHVHGHSQCTLITNTARVEKRSEQEHHRNLLSLISRQSLDEIYQHGTLPLCVCSIPAFAVVSQQRR